MSCHVMSSLITHLFRTTCSINYHHHRPLISCLQYHSLKTPHRPPPCHWLSPRIGVNRRSLCPQYQASPKPSGKDKTTNNGIAGHESNDKRYVDPQAFEEELRQLTIFQRYKKLFKEYWYVVIPVHGATSVVWLGSFYLLASSGVNIDLGYLADNIPFLSDSIKAYLNNPNLGNFAVAFALYKLATPFRYMSTLYFAVPAIKTLVKKRMIKPVPRLTSRKRFQQEITSLRRKIIRKRGE